MSTYPSSNHLPADALAEHKQSEEFRRTIDDRSIYTPPPGLPTYDYARWLPIMKHEDLRKQSLNALMLTSTTLLSPLWSMSQIPTVATNPLLRIGTYVACISCITALATGFILRIRLQYIASRRIVDQWMPNRQTIMSVSSVPFALLLSTLALFSLVLLGFTFETGFKMPVDLVNDTNLTFVEQIILVVSGTLAFVGTCSTTVASFVPAYEPEDDLTIHEKAHTYKTVLE